MDLKEEQLVLDRIIEKTKNIIEDEKEEIELLRKNSSIEKERRLQLIEDKKYKVEVLNDSVNNPYFARLNVKIDDEIIDVYIGKNAISQDDESYVTDWRAPISTLYYDSEVGKCSFNTLDNTINCYLNLKRQYEIEKGKLLNYYDVNLVSNDELLNKYLNTNNDSRLKTIISTIQKEQNDVIRKKLSNNLIIQGVAGSGKTTVALHRIAYLVYNYNKVIKDNEYLVIGPNDVFLKYIGKVLPDLNVNRVNQFTYCNFVKSYLNENINIIYDLNKPLEELTEKEKDISNFKCSLKYKSMIDLYIKDYIDNIFKDDIKLDNIIIIPKTHIINEFNEIYGKLETSLNVSIDLLINRLIKYISLRHDNLLDKYSKINMDLYNNEIDLKKKKEIKENLLKNRDEIKKNCRNIIRKYFSVITYDAHKIYNDFILKIKEYDVFNYIYIDNIKINKNTYAYDDAAALLYIKSIFKINEEYENIRHTVIDEAQDYNLFNFYSLKKVLPSSTFSVYGDLAQGIYDYRSIKNWNEVNEVLFNNEGKIIEFKKSYRTTKNIMSVADKVISSIGFSKSELVIREGEDVKYIDTVNNVEYIINRIQELKDKGYKSIAIISKNNLLSSKLNKELIKYNKEIVNINENNDLNEADICTLSTYMSKGLEFDAVIIDNCNEDIYDINNESDMKLLYIAITRALQSVDIIYNKNICKALK